MARPNFYNENENRYYPFLVGQGDGFVSKNVIVDCGFIMGPGSGYEAGTHKVWLGRMHRVGDKIRFYFRSDAPGLDGRPLVFTRYLIDPPLTHEYVDDETGEGSISESVSLLCESPLWSGYLVTGDLTDLFDTLLDNLDGQAIVEPANTRSLVNSYAHSINLANGDRTRFSAPDGCNPQCHTVPPQDVWVRQVCMQGPIRFQEGSNLSIRQDANRNALIFDAVEGGGTGQPGEQIEVYAGEEAPQHATNLDGAVGCDEVFRSINGLPGPNLNVIAGDGVRLEADPDNHKLIVNVDLSTFAACIDEEQEYEYTSLSPSDDCDCGEI